jgi:hypothetical protein
MRDYGKVHTSFWSSETIRHLSDDGKMLALYLMTSPHTTLIGAFRLPDGYASEDLGWDSKRVAKGFKELLANGFANRCETTKWVWIVKHLAWNPPENPNQRKAGQKLVAQIPSQCGWKPAFMRVSADILGLGPQEELNPCETLSEPLLNQEQEQEQEQEIKPLCETPDGFARFWRAWPATDRKVAKAECAKRWKARGLEKHADAIVEHVESLKASDTWMRGFEPAPLTFLNQQRWKDDLPAGGPSAVNGMFAGAI